MARVVLDACLPAGLRHVLRGHEVVTAHHLGWGNLDDADLLRAMSGRFDILLTADKGIPHQQKDARASVAIVVLRSRRIRLEELLAAVDQIQEALDRVGPGGTLVVPIG